jgi:hypothetical protein
MSSNRGDHRVRVWPPSTKDQPLAETFWASAGIQTRAYRRWAGPCGATISPADYRTIADVLISIDYTALYSPSYYEQVVQALDRTVSADRAFRFRSDFPDAWYDLNNPEQTATPMTVQFDIGREDFPPNLEELKIECLLLYLLRESTDLSEITISHLHLRPKGDPEVVGGAATSINGAVSTRDGNAGSWHSFIGKSPLGRWELALPSTAAMTSRFRDENIQEILFVITYTGQASPWPAL